MILLRANLIRILRNCISLRCRVLVALLVSLIIAAACNKEPETIGLELQSGNNPQIFHTDNLLVASHSVREDSVRTDETTNNLLGSYWDPVFGMTTAGFATQIRLSENGYSFGANPVLDSLILFLDYNGYYGDTNSAVSIKIFELSEKLNLDSTYYSVDEASDYGVEIGSKVFYPRPKTNVIIQGETEVPQLMVRLSDELGNRFLTASSSVFADNDSFLEYFYGLKLVTEPVTSPFSGSMLYFNLVSSASGAIIYFHNDSQDSLQFPFIINDKAARFTSYTHDYNLGSYEFRNQLGFGMDADTSLGKEKVYLQAMGGIKVKIRLPDITKIADSGRVAVNEAKLTLNGAPDNNDGYGAPAQLALIKITEDGSSALLDDQFQNYFGGVYDSTNNQYIFRITRHVQKLINGIEKDYGMYLLITRASYIGDRFELIGTDPSDVTLTGKRLKLGVTYTRVE